MIVKTQSVSKHMKEEEIQDTTQFTISDLANSLGMHREEKTISRILIELRKIHSAKIQQINVRLGKVFLYYYAIKEAPKATMKREERRSSSVAVKEEQFATVRQLIELNEKSYSILLEKIGEKEGTKE